MYEYQTTYFWVIAFVTCKLTYTLLRINYNNPGNQYISFSEHLLRRISQTLAFGNLEHQTYKKKSRQHSLNKYIRPKYTYSYRILTDLILVVIHRCMAFTFSTLSSKSLVRWSVSEETETHASAGVCKIHNYTMYSKTWTGYKCSTQAFLQVINIVSLPEEL